MVRQRLDHSSEAIPVMNSEELRSVHEHTGPLLLDFDGPITGLFLNGRNREIADQIRTVLTTNSISLPGDIESTHDPLIVLRWTYAHTPSTIFRQAEDACISGEIDAAMVSEPTPGAHELIRLCHRRGHAIGILSNNSIDAINAYLKRHSLRKVAPIVGRPLGRPDLMKPSLHLAHTALAKLRAKSADVLFVGDSLSDLEVARILNMPFIGYGKTPNRAKQLREHGASVVVESMSDISSLLT